MIKSFKIRLYPTREQEQLMWKHTNSCRYIYNYMLAKQTELRSLGEKHMSNFDMIKMLTPLKRDGEHEWLNDVSCVSLQRVCGDLNEAYQAFFKKRARFPKFKSKKKNKHVFPIDAVKLWFDEDNFAHIIKIGKVKFRTDFDIPRGTGYKLSNPRVSNINGKWILSFGIECENQAFTLTDKDMGIDLGIKELAVVAFGEDNFVFHNINKSKKMRALKRKLKHTQRTISRKYEANKQGNRFIKTNNIVRQEDKLRKIYKRLSDIRTNYIHQTTHKLVSMLPKKITMEDLNIAGMMKNRHLSRAIQEQCFYEFIRQMKYKCEWYGIEFVQADRFYPSSKNCSSCGNKKKDLRLNDRTYICNECGLVIDRDYNAAINLMRYTA